MPENTNIFSEQELRCIPDELWPEWIPQSTLHRPDGYSRFTLNDKQILCAFEAELSLKGKKRYEACVYFYESETMIDYVFWLVRTKGVAKSIQRIFERENARTKSSKCCLL